MRLALVFLMSLALGTLAARAQAPQPNTAPPAGVPTLDPGTMDDFRRDGVKLNFEDVDIRVLTRIISQYTRRNVLLDQKVQGKVTISSSRRLGADEAWDLYVSVLEAYGFGVEKRGSYYQVAPMATVRPRQMRLYPRKGQVQVAIIKVEHLAADQMVNLLRPVLSASGTITGQANSNTIVVTDESTIVKRVMLMAKRLDVVGKESSLRIYYPRRVRAKDVEKNVTALFPDRNAVKITVHEPTNGLLIMALPDQHRIIGRLLQSLERRDQVELEPRQFFVYYLSHSKAEDMAKILADMLQERQRVEKQAVESGGVTSSAPTGAPQGGSVIPTPPAMQRTEPFPAGNPAMPGMLAQAPAGPPTSPPFASTAETFPQTSTVPISPAQVSTAPGSFSSQKVSADPSNNALVFYMPATEYAVVKKLVEQLDVPRKQVLISVIVAEVTMSKLADAGVRWQAATSNGVVAAFQGGVTLPALLQSLASGQFVLGSISPTTQSITVNGQQVQYPSSFALVNFLMQQNNSNLISSPRLLTQNHKQADIKVGKVVPFATGARFDINGQPIVNFDYREVGLNLKITPHISADQTVRLEFHEDLQEVLQYVQQGVGAASFSVPIVSKREVNTEVVLQDGQTLIIGGLVDRRTIEQIHKFPVLGDIPILGDLLFKTRHKEQQRTTLFMFLTPHVVDSPQKMKDLTTQYDRMLEQRMKTDKEAVQRQDYHPEKSLPEAVKNPMLRPIPGPAPTSEPSQGPYTLPGQPEQRPIPAPPRPPRVTPPPSPYGPGTKGNGRTGAKAPVAPVSRVAPAPSADHLPVLDNEPGRPGGNAGGAVQPALGTPSSAFPTPSGEQPPAPASTPATAPPRDDREWI